MAAVVFLRGVNVGGRKAFRPAALAGELSALDVVNVGAAGTFVVFAAVTHAALRAELLSRLPFELEIMICRAGDVVRLVEEEPFGSASPDRDVRRFVSVLARRPRPVPPLPLAHPAGRAWQVKVVGLRGRLATSLWRRAKKATVYPNEVVEKRFGVPATTRTWNTIVKVRDILEEGPRTSAERP